LPFISNLDIDDRFISEVNARKIVSPDNSYSTHVKISLLKL